MWVRRTLVTNMRLIPFCSSPQLCKPSVGSRAFVSPSKDICFVAGRINSRSVGDHQAFHRGGSADVNLSVTGDVRSSLGARVHHPLSGHFWPACAHGADLSGK